MIKHCDIELNVRVMRKDAEVIDAQDKDALK